MKIILVVAYSKNYAIGKDNQLLWHLADDMSFFKQTTLNQTVLMGKNTYLSIPEKFRPLPKRDNIVISSQKPIEITDNLTWFTTLEEAIDTLTKSGLSELYIIGGASIYKQLLPLADSIYATEVDVVLEGDAFFPEIDITKYNKETLSTHTKNEKNDFGFTIVKYSKI